MNEPLTTEQQVDYSSDPRRDPRWREYSRDYQMVLLLGAVLDKLEDVRCCVIDVENAALSTREALRHG